MEMSWVCPEPWPVAALAGENLFQRFRPQPVLLLYSLNFAACAGRMKSNSLETAQQHRLRPWDDHFYAGFTARGDLWHGAFTPACATNRP